MKLNILQRNRTLRSVLLILLLGVAWMTKMNAENITDERNTQFYDIFAVPYQSIGFEELPCPIEGVTDIYPCDNALYIPTEDLILHWKLNDYANEWRLVFSNTYWPEDEIGTEPITCITEWSSDLQESFNISAALEAQGYQLRRNANYFWHIDQRSNPSTSYECYPQSHVFGFTTSLSIPTDLTANYTHSTRIFENEETVTLRWNPIVDRNDRTFLHYRIYLNGESVHETPNNNWVVPADMLTYNMYNTQGYLFNVTAVYDEGESHFSNSVEIRVSGKGSVSGYVWEQDEVTPIGGVTVTIQGMNEFGNAEAYFFVTDENGYYQGAVHAGSYYIAVATKDGYQNAYTLHPYPFFVDYSCETDHVDFIIDELFLAPAHVCAKTVYVPEADGDSLVQVRWDFNFFTELRENFEDWGNTPYIWQNDATYPWTLTTDAHEGTYALKSGNAGVAISNSAISVTVAIPQDGMFSFDYKCQGEGTTTYCDHCDFVMDGTTIFSHGADLAGWHTFNQPISAGTHTFKWSYTKDSSVNPTGDCFTIDNIVFVGQYGNKDNTRSLHHYNIYRTDCSNNGPYTDENTAFLAAVWCPDVSYFDVSWPEAPAGVYKYGVSAVYVGNQADNPNNPRVDYPNEERESEIMWSDLCGPCVSTFEDDINHWTPVAEGQYPFSMTLYGVIAINGVEQTNNQLELGVFCGDECRGTAMASEFFLTHRYLAEVNVYGDSGQELTFKLYNHATNQELDLTPPEAIIFTIDGYGNPVNPYVLNFTSSVSITATTDPEGAGTVTGTGEYTLGATCTLTATANMGFQFQNWTLNGTIVSTNPSYTFTVTGAANYVAHFQYVQSRTLVSGWNWWSTYIEQNGTNGLEMLENSLGTSGIRIQGKNNSVDYFEYQGTGYWYGSLNTLTNEQMYMIRTSAACDAVIVGDAALPSNHPITINGGWNWIGYPYSQSVSVDAAMAGFTPEPNDVIKGRSNASMYLSYGGYQGWYGQLNTLEPGQGYMYRSYSDATKTLRFQTGRGGETLANVTPEGNVFVPNTDNYADNMIVTAVIDMEGTELRSEDYELAAFAGNECRGSVKLMYVEPYDRYVALLMAYGEGGEELRFVLTDGEGTSWSNDRVTYTANGMVGTMTEPTVLHFGPMGTEDNLQKPIHVYPNPSNGIFNIEGEGIQKIEVIDIYGQVILSKEVKNANHKVDLSDKAAGAYLLRVVTVDGIVTHKLIKNN